MNAFPERSFSPPAGKWDYTRCPETECGYTGCHQWSLEDFADISWVSVGIHGTDATIRLAETIGGVEIIDKETPCDIVASTDGVILQITAERGTPLVAAGDVVKKGDVLISSALTIGLEGRNSIRNTPRRRAP